MPNLKELALNTMKSVEAAFDAVVAPFEEMVGTLGLPLPPKPPKPSQVIESIMAGEGIPIPKLPVIGGVDIGVKPKTVTLGVRTGEEGVAKAEIGVVPEKEKRELFTGIVMA